MTALVSVEGISALVFTATLLYITKPVRHAVLKTPDAYKHTEGGQKESSIFMRFIIQGGAPRFVAECILLATIYNITTTLVAVLRPDVYPKLCPHSPASRFSATSIGWTMIPTFALVVGTKIRLRAFSELADSFTYTLTVPKNGLITSGIYRQIRHPSYTGLYMLGIAGAFFCVKGIDCWLPYDYVLPIVGVIEFVTCLAFLRLRIDKEEQFLKKEFGKEYVEYMDRSWRLIPYVY